MAQAQQAGQPNRQQPKKVGKNKFAHTPNTPYGMGDFYGTGVKQKIGRVRENTIGFNAVPPKKLKVPPKSLA
jgi:hypothetical protein